MREMHGMALSIDQDHGPDDTALIRASCVDPAAFAALYERHRDRVYWYLRTRTVSADDAADLLQQVFLQALHRGYVGNSETGQPDAALQWFDTAGITGQPKSLHLRVTIPWIDGMKQLQGPPTAEASSMQGLPTTGPYGSIATIHPPTIGVTDVWTHDFRVYGPLSFDVTVPFVAGVEVSPHQQVNAGGTTLTLERVVVSPTETRAYVSGLDPNQSHYVDGILSGDGWTDEDFDGGSSGVFYSNGLTEFSHFGDFIDKHGAWTLTVKPLNAEPAPAPAGTWTFHFAVP